MKKTLYFIPLFWIGLLLSVRAQTCPTFQFTLCSVEDAISPSGPTGRITISGPTAPANQPWAIVVQNTSGGPSSVKQSYNNQAGGCSGNPSSFTLSGVYPGNYRVIFKKQNLSCVDTVLVTVGSSPCSYKGKTWLTRKISPTTAGGANGKVVLSYYNTSELGEGVTGYLVYPVIRISKNGGPFVQPPPKWAGLPYNSKPVFGPTDFMNVCNDIPQNQDTLWWKVNSLLLCDLSEGDYKVAFYAGYDSTCRDTVSFTLFDNPCTEFKFDLCSVSPIPHPTQQNFGKVVYKSNYVTLDGSNYIYHKIFKETGEQVPNNMTSTLYQMLAPDANSNCGWLETWSNARAMFSIPTGNYYSVMMRAFDDQTCLDTVHFTMPAYPCTYSPDSVKSFAPSAPGAADGKIKVVDAEGMEGNIQISKDGGPFTYPAMSYKCGNIDVCPPPPDPHDPPPFDPCDPGSAMHYALKCDLSAGTYRVVVTSAYDLYCSDTVTVQVGEVTNPCSGFQFDLCSVSPTAKPAEFGKKVVFTSSYMPTGFTDNLTYNANWVENPEGSHAVYKLNQNQPGAACTSNSIWGFTITELALPPGNYYQVFIQPGGLCRDTVLFTLPDYPCNFEVDSVNPHAATSANTADGFVYIKALNNLKTPFADNIGTAPVMVSKDNGPFANRNGTIGCVGYLLNCIPEAGDPPPFPMCSPDEQSSYLTLCGLTPGNYRAIVPYAWSWNCADTVSFVIGPVTAPDTVARPVASIPSGTYTGNQTVTLSSATPGALIYYTLNGNLPNTELPNSFTKSYSGPIVISQNTTLRAMAIAGGNKSAVVTRNYTITSPQLAANPVFSLPGGTYSGIQSLTITCSTPGATIYYTLNGNVPRLDVPNSFTKVYTGALALSQSATVRALATAGGSVNSGVTSANYVITTVQNVAAPTFGPPPGVYGSSQAVTISCATAGAEILYTTNGMTPKYGLFAAKVYSTPVNISTTLQLKARAFLPGAIESPITVGNYTIGAIRKAVNGDELDYYFTPGEDESELNSSSLTAFPNPSLSGIFEVSGLDTDAGEIQVVNGLGQTIEFTFDKMENNTILIDLGKKASGLYLLKVTNANGIKELRLVK